MVPTSLPKIPAPPDLPAYGVSSLNLFVVYNRATYLEAFKVQAPVFDPTRPVQNWFDTTKRPAGVVTYNVFVGVFPPVFTPMVMSTAQAQKPNLSGDYTYAVYAPSPVTVATSNGELINAAVLCSYQEALHLSQALGSTELPIEDGESDGVLWGTELRRMWDVFVPGSDGPVNAAALLATWWKNGIGAPGRWNLANPNVPVWDPAPPVNQLTLGIVPTPVRDMLSTESIQAVMMGMAYEIVNSAFKPAATR